MWELTKEEVEEKKEVLLRLVRDVSLSDLQNFSLDYEELKSRIESKDNLILEQVYKDLCMIPMQVKVKDLYNDDYVYWDIRYKRIFMSVAVIEKKLLVSEYFNCYLNNKEVLSSVHIDVLKEVILEQVRRL